MNIFVDMKSGFRKVLVLAILVVVICSCASDHNEPFLDSLSDDKKVRDLDLKIHAVVKSNNSLSIKEIGQVTYGDFSRPISVISYQNKETDCKTLINAAIHGDEPASALSVITLIEILLNHKLKCSFDIIPVINPWGFSQNIRFNKQGIDINRDFASFKSQESKIIKSYITGKQYNLMIDLHEDPDSKGFYIYQYGRPDTKIPEKVVNKIHKMGYPIEQDVNMVILKTENGIIDAPMWGLWYMRLTRQLSIANFYRLHNSKEVFTIETPTHLPLKDRILMQTAAVRVLIDEIYGLQLKESK
ncbi:MAG: M14 family metallocarboxypeptidase [Desulfobacteraceae bacterium]|nr:M14 family metallocarboxypeptidase [Desulfobacteraceae bacterium]